MCHDPFGSGSVSQKLQTLVPTLLAIHQGGAGAAAARAARLADRYALPLPRLGQLAPPALHPAEQLGTGESRVPKYQIDNILKILR